MIVRRIEVVKLNDAIELIKRVFEEFEYFDYDQEGINNFYKSIELETLLKEINNENLKLIGTFEKKVLTGVLGYKDNRIVLFYVDYDYQGHGMGKALLQHYLEESKFKGIRQVVVNSTLLVEEIFEKYGFYKTGEAIKENGITYVPMAYILANVALGSFVNVIVDAPIGMIHPYLPDTFYNVNFGFISDILSINEQFQEAYIYNVYEPIESFNGTVIGIIHYKDRDSTKWIVSNSIEFDKDDVMNDLRDLEQGVDLKFEWLNIN
ncbi:MAG: GNAT family N-acetyltransferase [Erysipelotrichaceae bacterium]|nr:GNAT family N-acetyltransferase [Erysipelotrichaceae bacterium]